MVKVCSNCKYVSEWVSSKTTWKCSLIRDGKMNEYGYAESEMKVSKYKPACQFFKEGL